MPRSPIHRVRTPRNQRELTWYSTADLQRMLTYLDVLGADPPSGSPPPTPRWIQRPPVLSRRFGVPLTALPATTPGVACATIQRSSTSLGVSP
jgi:hypothetical protein